MIWRVPGPTGQPTFTGRSFYTFQSCFLIVRSILIRKSEVSYKSYSDWFWLGLFWLFSNLLAFVEVSTPFNYRCLSITFFVAFCSFFPCSLTVFHRKKKQKSRDRQWKSSRAEQQNNFFIFQPEFNLEISSKNATKHPVA